MGQETAPDLEPDLGSSSFTVFVVFTQLTSFVSLTFFIFLHAKLLSHVQLPVTPWTGARQSPLSKGFSRQEYWRELPCTPPGELPNPGIKPTALTFSALAGRFFTTSTI